MKHTFFLFFHAIILQGGEGEGAQPRDTAMHDIPVLHAHRYSLMRRKREQQLIERGLLCFVELAIQQ